MNTPSRLIALAAVAASLAGGRVDAANRYWTGTGIWNTTNTNWGTVSGGPYTSTWSNSPADTAFFEGTSGTVTLTTSMTTSGVTTFSVSGYVLTGGTIGLGGNISVAGGATARIESVLATASAFQKTSTGTLRLGGANTFSGGMVALGGVTEFESLANSGSPSALGASGVLRTNGGIFSYVGTGHASNRLFTFGQASGGAGSSHTLRANGTGALNLTNSGSNDWGANNQDRSLTLGGTNTSANTFSARISNNGSGVASVFKSDAGTWILTGSNSHSGGTTLNSGTLGLGNANALGTGTATFGGNATLRANVSATVTNVMSTGASSAVTATIDTQANAVTLSGSIGGAGNLAKLGTATLTLTSANNAYTGATTIAAGTLALSGGGSVASSSGLNISGAAARLDISAASGDRTIAALEGVAGSSVVLGGNTLTAGDATTRIFGGAISGSGGFTKAGSGILTLADVQTFTGSASINAGTLAIGGANTLATARRIYVASGATLDATAAGLTVGNAQTLAGSGTVTGGFTIAGGATLSPGNSPGTLSVTGPTTWGPGGNYNWQIHTVAGGAGSGWDLLDSTGTLDVTSSGGNPFSINLWSLAGLPDTTGNVSDFDAGASNNFLIAEFDGGITGWDPAKFSLNTTATNGTGGFTNTIAGQGTFTVARGDTVSGGNANQIYVVYAAVPEPGALALAGIGLAAAGWAARRRVPVRATRRGT